VGARIRFRPPRRDGVPRHRAAHGHGLRRVRTGKTAIKVSLSKYWQSANNEGNYTTANRAATFAPTTTRAWTTGTGTSFPDCDLANRARQDNTAAGGDLCGAWDNQNFGSIVSATVLNPRCSRGGACAPFDWQFGVSVQQEILPRLSAELAYNRRSWATSSTPTTAPWDRRITTRSTFAAPTHPDLATSGQPCPTSC
jgi:hypothetical protein